MNAPSQGVLRCVLITDLVDSTQLVVRLGDAAAHEQFMRHDRLARDLIRRHDGQEIDKSDGFLLLFERPQQAVAFALDYHEALRRFSSASGQQWRARAGIHFGEVYLHANSADDIARGAKPVEVEGLAKPIAARLMGLARGGQTLLTGPAFDHAQRAAIDFASYELGWQAHGRYRFQGLDEPVAVFEVGVPGHAPLSPPPSSPKAQREISPDEAELLGWRPGPHLPAPRREHWRLSRKLGAGGFGEVWLAQHEQSGALRVFKYCHDAERLRSFKREVTVFRLLRDALGDRADIVRIIDWNLDEAPYFLELEYIPGGDLLSYAEAQGGLTALSLDLRVELVAQIADALAAAHSVGVLHKDIKPANVLIRQDEAGRPQALLTDFGIGLVTDKHQLLARGITMAGFTEMIGQQPTGGSQIYMAPELLEGKAASIQADLFALGVMLYELAAGAFKPIAPGWQRDIGDELLAADIANLVDGDPTRRPASAAHVARELRALPQRRARLAAERQALAQAEANRTALQRAQRRRKWALGLAAALALVSTLVGYSAWQASIARDNAEFQRQQADQLIGFMLDDLRKKLEPLGRLDLLDAVGVQAMSYFERAGDQGLSDVELQRRAQALYQIGEVRVQRGDLEGAAEALDDSIRIYDDLIAHDPKQREWLFGLGQAQFWRGMVERRRGKLAETLQRWQVYFQLASRLAELDPNDIRWQQELVYAWGNLGLVHQWLSHSDQALQAFQTQLSIAERLLKLQPDAPATLAQVAGVYNKLGDLARVSAQPQTALKHFDREIELLDLALAQQAGNASFRYRRAIALSFRASVQTWLAQYEAAAESANESVIEFTRLSTSDPSNRTWERNWIAGRNRLARIEIYRGRLLAADQILQKIEPAAAALAGASPHHVQLQTSLAEVRITRAIWLLVEDKPTEAAATLADVDRTLAAAAMNAPDDYSVQRELALSAFYAGAAALQRGALAEAHSLARNASTALRQVAKRQTDPVILASAIAAEWIWSGKTAVDLQTSLQSAGFPHWRALLPLTLSAPVTASR